MRRLLTRCFGLIPSMIVAVAIGKDGVDAMLVASQVVLSIVLPFIVFPLMVLTSRKDVMTVKVERVVDDNVSEIEKDVGESEKNAGENGNETKSQDGSPLSPCGTLHHSDANVNLEGAEETVCYANGWVTIALGWILWVIVVAANVYAIVSLGLGTAS